jgi:ammonia channel protein AmtB
VTVVWTLIGYSLAFGTDIGGFIGGSTSWTPMAWRVIPSCSWSSR